MGSDRMTSARARSATVSCGLILRSHAKRGVSKDGAAPWFETPCFARLLTMRLGEVGASSVPSDALVIA